MKSALMALRVDGLSIRKAATIYKVPRKTLGRYHESYEYLTDAELGEVQFPKRGGDANRILTDEQEDALKDFLIKRAALDSCVHTLAVREKAMKLAVSRRTDFQRLQTLPTNKWLKLFMERTGLSARYGQMLSNARRDSFTMEALVDMEKKLRAVAAEKAIVRPDQVVVMDESGDNYEKVSRSRVVGSQAARGFTTSEGSGERGMHCSWKIGAFADGTRTKSLIIFPGQRFTTEEVEEINNLCGDEILFYKNAQGSCDSVSMIAWVERAVLPRAQRKRGEWLLIILDQY